LIISGNALLKRLAMVAPLRTDTLDVVKELMDKGQIVISPFPDISKILRAVSLTMEIGEIKEPKIPSTSQWICIDFSQLETLKEADKSFSPFKGEKFYLHPGVHNFARIETKQFLGIPNDLLGEITVKEEFRKYGLSLIGGINYLPPRFMGRVTADITNSGNRPIVLSVGLPIFEARFHLLSSPIEP